METAVLHEQNVVVDYSFLEYEALERMRLEQAAHLNNVADKALSDLSLHDSFFYEPELRQEVIEAEKPEMDRKLEESLDSTISREDNPLLFDKILGLLSSVSAYNMTPTEWYNGDKGQDGNYDYTTSGRYQAEQLLLELQAEAEATILAGLNTGVDDEAEAVVPTDVPITEPEYGHPVDMSSAEFGTAAATLEAARGTLAEKSVARRQMLTKNSQTAKDLEVQYSAAKVAYDQAVLTIVNMYIAGYRSQGRSEQYILEKLLPRMIDTHKQFAEAEIEVLKNDETTRGRAARFLAKKGALFGLSAGSGFAIGLGARIISKSVLALGIGVTGGLAAGGVLAARTTKNVLLAKVTSTAELYKNFEKRRDQDVSELETHQATIATNENTEDAIAAMHNKVIQVRDGRVEKDRASNVRRLVLASAIGGAAALAAFELAPIIGHELREAADYLKDHRPDGLTLGKPNVDLPTIGDGGDGQGKIPTITHPYTGSINSGPDAGLGHGVTHPEAGAINSGPDSVVGHGAGVPDTGSGANGDTSGSTTDGFERHVTVENGHGFIKELQDLAAQQNIHLTGQQATDAYNHMLHEQGNANFFSNDPTYTDHGDYRISKPGFANWNPHATHLFYQWLEDKDLVKS